MFHVYVLRKVIRVPELIIKRPPEDLESNLSVWGLLVRIIGHQVIETVRSPRWYKFSRKHMGSKKIPGN